MRKTKHQVKQEANDSEVPLETRARVVLFLVGADASSSFPVSAAGPPLCMSLLAHFLAGLAGDDGCLELSAAASSAGASPSPGEGSLWTHRRRVTSV